MPPRNEASVGVISSSFVGNIVFSPLLELVEVHVPQARVLKNNYLKIIELYQTPIKNLKIFINFIAIESNLI